MQQASDDTKANGHGLTSRYLAIEKEIIEKCRCAYDAGYDLGHVVPGLTGDQVALIAIESLEAERLLSLPPARLLENLADPMSDWSMAVLLELFSRLSEILADKGEKEQEEFFLQLAWYMLERIVASPTASPLLEYEEIYWDLIEALWMEHDERSTEIIKTALAYNLRFHRGDRAVDFLCALAEDALRRGALSQGLEMFASLLRNDPADVWIYVAIAGSLLDLGLNKLALEVTERGFELLQATGDPEELYAELSKYRKQCRQDATANDVPSIDPKALASLRAALHTDFKGGERRPVAELCRELVPDLDKIPVKRPLEIDDLSAQSFKPSRRGSRAGRRSRPATLGERPK